jgi:hypothetical protein
MLTSLVFLIGMQQLRFIPHVEALSSVDAGGWEVSSPSSRMAQALVFREFFSPVPGSEFQYEELTTIARFRDSRGKVLKSIELQLGLLPQEALTEGLLMRTMILASKHEPGFPEQTLSGFPAGRKWWSPDPPTPGLAGSTGWALRAADGRLAVWADLGYSALDPLARSLKSPPVERADLLLTESLARKLLARAQATRAQLAQAPLAAVTARTDLAARRLADGSLVVPLPTGARGWSAKEEGGVWTLTSGNSTIVAPLAAYVVIVNGKEIKLKHPIMEMDRRPWIEHSAITSVAR